MFLQALKNSEDVYNFIRGLATFFFFFFFFSEGPSVTCTLLICLFLYYMITMQVLLFDSNVQCCCVSGEAELQKRMREWVTTRLQNVNFFLSRMRICCSAILFFCKQSKSNTTRYLILAWVVCYVFTGLEK